MRKSCEAFTELKVKVSPMPAVKKIDPRSFQDDEQKNLLPQKKIQLIDTIAIAT